MYCCEKKCNLCYYVISINLIVVLLIWNIISTVAASNNNPAHINSFNYAPENLPNGGYITFDTNSVIEKNDITHQEGSSDFIINQSGNYYVQFNTTILVQSSSCYNLILALSE